MQKIILNDEIVDFDFVIINNRNNVLFFKYNTYLRIKKEIREKIFLNTNVNTNDILNINKLLKEYNLICYLQKNIGNVYYYHIVTIDSYNEMNLRHKVFIKAENRKPRKIKVNLSNKSDSSLDLSDLD